MYSTSFGVEPETFTGALIAAYGVSEVISLSPIRSGPLSLAWKVEGTREGSQFCWCVKRHRNKRIERLQFEFQFLQAMRAQEFGLIPPVVPTAAGCDWLKLGDELLSAFEYVSSDPTFDWTRAGWTPGQCRAAAGALAEFHKFAERSEPALNPSPEWLRPYAPELMDSVEASIRSAAIRSIGDPLLELIANQQESILRSVSAAVSALSQTSEKMQLIHGDFHPGNVLFSGHEVRAVLDLDYVHRDSPVLDVAYGALLFAGVWDCPTDYILNPVRLESFLDGYRTRLEHSETLFEKYLIIAKAMVFYWLLDIYAGEPMVRERIAVPLANCLKSLL